jgi:hypothetical protein
MIADRDTPFRPWLHLMRCILNHSDECIHRVINYVADCGGHRHDTFYQLFINTSPAELTQVLKMSTCVATPTYWVVIRKEASSEIQV